VDVHEMGRETRDAMNLSLILCIYIVYGMILWPNFFFDR
jgi:hypothetical protein